MTTRTKVVDAAKQAVKLEAGLAGIEERLYDAAVVIAPEGGPQVRYLKPDQVAIECARLTATYARQLRAWGFSGTVELLAYRYPFAAGLMKGVE